MSHRNIAILPARGGSRRILRKNIRSFEGRPIIAYPIAAAQASRLFDRILVSTEDAEIADVARSCGAEVLHRSAELARDEIGTQELMAYHLTYDLRDANDYACCLYPCTPLLLAEDLEAGLRKLWGRPRKSFCYAVTRNHSEGYTDAGAFYWGRVQAFRDGVPLRDRAEAIWYKLPRERACDINTPDDWREAVRKFKALKEAQAA